MKDDQVYIKHILEAIQSAEEYLIPIVRVVWTTMKEDIPILKELLLKVNNL